MDDGETLLLPLVSLVNDGVDALGVKRLGRMLLSPTAGVVACDCCDGVDDGAEDDGPAPSLLCCMLPLPAALRWARAFS